MMDMDKLSEDERIIADSLSLRFGRSCRRAAGPRMGRA